MQNLKYYSQQVIQFQFVCVFLWRLEYLKYLVHYLLFHNKLYLDFTIILYMHHVYL